MTKTVFRYFFDFIDSQEIWLNQMAEKGYRLKTCGKAWYTFESCKANEYEYAVEFIGDKSYKTSKDYKAFLENMGYRTFYKNVNLNFSIGKIKWRPWAKGMGQIATSPGSFNKELLIVEKLKDGKPFELHTDLNDLISGYCTLRKAYLWGAVQMLILAALALYYGLTSFDLQAWLAVIVFVLVIPWINTIIKYSKIIKKLKQQNITNE